MTFSDWFLRAAGHSDHRARLLAEASRAREQRAVIEALEADEVAFEKSMAQVARKPHVTLGATQRGVSYRISVEDLVSLPSWVTAATGAGKSRFCGSFMEQLIARIAAGEPLSLVEIDGKGEGADMTLRSVTRQAERLRGSERDRFLQRVRVLRFFDDRFLPTWNILAPQPGVAAPAQADAVADVLSEVVADATVGPRQRATLAGVLSLGVEFGVPFAALPWLLSAPQQVAALAAQSRFASVRLQLSRFEREPQGSIDGLLARISTILRIPSLKAVFSARDPLSFTASFEPGTITVIDFGGAPFGALSAVRAVGSLAVAGLANAAFDPRRVVRSRCLLVVDEPQVFATGVALEHFQRIMSLGRSFGAGGLMLVHQGPTQLAPTFLDLLSTNVTLRVIGRSSEADASAASEWLPITHAVSRPRAPGARRGGESRFLSDGEERRHRIGEIGHLPARHFLVADRRVATQPRIVQAQFYEPPRWDQLDPTIAERIRRGAIGVPRAELEARVVEIEEQASRMHEEANAGAPEQGRRRGRSRKTPNVVNGEPTEGEVP